MRRAIQFERVFVAAEVLRSLTRGATLPVLTSEVSHRTGKTWHERTIRRDLELLEYLGLVERKLCPLFKRIPASRWKWIGQKVLIETDSKRVGPAVRMIGHRKEMCRRA